MRLDRRLAAHARSAWYGTTLALAISLCGCAAPAETVREPPAIIVANPAARPASAPVAVMAVPAERPAAPPSPVEAVLGYAERLRGLQPAELAQEISRFGDAGESAVRLMQLAIALAQTKAPANTLRAQALLQRVLGQSEPEARALQPLARLLAPQLADTRRAEEQVERQAQQLRDAQRRIDQLNERLEAVRAIERSLPSVPASGASAPAAPRP
jgi:hypothetical protein